MNGRLMSHYNVCAMCSVINLALAETEKNGFGMYDIVRSKYSTPIQYQPNIELLLSSKESGFHYL